MSDHVIPLAGRVGPRPAPTSRLPRPVRGVLFDVCNVLYDNTLWRRWMVQLLSRVGVRTDYRSLFRLWDQEYLVDVHRGQRPLCEAFESLLCSLGLRPGQIDEIGAACLGRQRQLEATTRPLPGVKSTLTQLHRSGHTLGAISNSHYSAEVLADRLGRFGLDGLFAAIVSSIDLGHAMPEPVCYQTALWAMGLRPDEVAFVDHDAAELAGAAALGMATIAVNYDPDVRADIYLARFEELVEAVRVPQALAAAG